LHGGKNPAQAAVAIVEEADFKEHHDKYTDHQEGMHAARAGTTKGLSGAIK
jgi:hypothetical protein